MVWDRLAKKYDRLWVQKYSLSPTRREVMRRLNRDIKTLLDLGCATGQLIEEATARYGPCCTGIDKSPAMINIARGKGVDARFILWDISDGVPEELSGRTFDAIVCTHSFPYYRDKRAALQSLFDLSRKDTRLIFVHACINSLYDRLVMKIVEGTAERAHYPSRNEFLSLVSPLFEVEEQFSIRERWFMPSICGFVLTRKEGSL